MPRLLVHLPGTISFIETMDTCDIVARKFGAYVFPSSDQYIASQQKDLIPDVIVTTDRERFEGTKMLRDFRDSISGSHVLLLKIQGT